MVPETSTSPHTLIQGAGGKVLVQTRGAFKRGGQYSVLQLNIHLASTLTNLSLLPGAKIKRTTLTMVQRRPRGGEGTSAPSDSRFWIPETHRSGSPV